MPQQQHKLLIANRGEIAIRIAHAANELNIPTVGIYSQDDENSLHIRKTDEAIPLQGKGAAAYLDALQIIEIAKQTGCNMIHSGYGFLSENANFALQCAANKITFVGPTPKTLEVFGNKMAARQLAQYCDIPTIEGTFRATTLSEAQVFFSEQLKEGEGLMLKAIAGGGGRGMRAVFASEDMEVAYKRCQSEALQSFGNGDLYVEKLIQNARHIEIQIIGDGTGEVSHLGERECSIQRRHQKLIEIAPCPNLSPILRQKLCNASVKMAKAVHYANAGTFEFLVDKSLADDAAFYFMEANPRLQVEHTVTEEVTGIDIVQFQLQQAMGKTLAELDLLQSQISASKGCAIQLRINMESIDKDGSVRPSGGQLTTFEIPVGKGIRVDTFGYKGYRTSPNFDSLLAKVIVSVRSDDFGDVVRKASRALADVRIEGVATNVGFLGAILGNSEFLEGDFDIGFVEGNLAALVDSIALGPPPNPLPFGEGILRQNSPMIGSIVSIEVEVGQRVKKGQALVVMEAMKMESVILAEESGVVHSIAVEVGDVVTDRQPLLFLEVAEMEDGETLEEKAVDLDYIRPDLAELFQRQYFTKDEARPIAVEKRHKYGQQTARENIDLLCDANSFREYGSLIVAAQRRRRTLQDLVENTPADGLITGIGAVNGSDFGEEKARCMVMAYDYTVLAGTQGTLNHKKMDRMFHLAEEWRIPLVLFVEGGGGRPGDTDYMIVAGLDILTFTLFARMSGLVPRISIVSRYCFAGNAVLAGAADVIIATENTSLGMGGPAMIEGGGLGKFHPKDVGPASFQTTNGVIDILVKDEVAAIAAAKKYLSYFQGTTMSWECADQRLLRSAIPENRRRVYDIRSVIETMADTDSVLELRPYFGVGMVTALIRIEGRAMGLIANNPKHLGGAIDSDGADKAARFMQLCDAFGIPIVALCDTPGIMVGPDAEKTGTVRHAARLFVVSGSLRVPYFSIVLRKGYGLGAMAMTAGSFSRSFFTVAWPTGEFGAMGLEGAVELGFRKELDAAMKESPEAHKALYDKLVAKSYERGKGISMAAFFEIDQVIDPMESREWLVMGLKSVPKLKEDGKRRFVDTW
ncbi:MAG: carboxyl transferase domain-containing protein [Chitinophagales bacterium]